VSIYRFNDHSLIENVTIERSAGGGMRAYLFARAGSDPAKLESLKSAFNAHGILWAPTSEDGRAVLELRGLKQDESSLLRLLKMQGAVTSNYQKSASIGDKISLEDSLKKNTLKASGWAYFIGDMSFLVYGWKEAFEGKKLTKPAALIAGIFYALGTPAMMFFGRGDKSDFQLKDISNNTLNELKKQGVSIPDGAAISAVSSGHTASFGRRVLNFLQRYPAEITNGLFGVAGTMMLWTGIRDYKNVRQEIAKNGKQNKGSRLVTAIIDMGIGVFTVFSGLVSVFVEEEEPNRNEPKNTGLARAWQFVTEKPLRTAGAALGISTLGHATATAIQYKAGEISTSAVAGRGVFSFTNLSAEGLMAISSKGHGAGVKSDNSLDRSVYAVMADLVQRSPSENRERLIEQLTSYLSGKKHLGGEASAISQGIREQLATYANNPWITPTATQTPSMEKPAEEPSTRWQKKMTPAQAETLSATPSMM